MEETLFSLNNLRHMEVIDIKEGRKLGLIADVKLDCDESKIISFILPTEKASWFSKMDVIEIPWENVYKVGLDVILVNITESN